MNQWRETFPALAASAESELSSLLDEAHQITLEAGSNAFRQGDECSNYLLVLSGQVRVLTRAENGREIVLYRLSDGDSCVLTTSCLFGQTRYPAEGIADSKVLALAIPANKFHSALQQSETFRQFVFASFSAHLSSLIGLVEEVAFERLDIRLARQLLERGQNGPEIQLTHQELATELGTAREVISRQLKDMESRGWLKLGRGKLQLLDLHALQQLAQK
ncbi:MAG: Crp/Fnr family transcriptional regulator [bacterium]